MLEFRVLGPLEADRDGAPVELGGAKQQALLALLLLEDGRAVSTGRLADGLWGSEAPASAAKALQLYVSQLRKALGSAAIETRPDAYVIPARAAIVDLRHFEQLAEGGRSQASAGRLTEAARLLGEAMALWRGEALEGLDEPGLAPLRSRLEELRLVVYEHRVDVGLAAGDHGRLLPDLVLTSRRHPLRERLQEQLMLALYRDGRQAEALAVFRDLRERLRDQLGLEPQPRLRRLEQAILRQELDLDPPLPAERRRTVVAAGRNPARLAELLAPLVRALPGELILLDPVSRADQLAGASADLEAQRTQDVRVAAFVSRQPDREVARLAADEAAELVVLEAASGQLRTWLLDDLGRLACDVALFLDGDGGLPGRAVAVLFGGAPDDWRAVELGAVLARSAGVPLQLLGADLGERDASSLLARAAIVVQRFAAIATEPALFVPGRPESIGEAAAGGMLVAAVGGLEEDGLRPSRARLVEAGRPLLLLRPGPRPGLLAPPQTLTRFSWSLIG